MFVPAGLPACQSAYLGRLGRVQAGGAASLVRFFFLLAPSNGREELVGRTDSETVSS
jgi:hypothetical protein